MNQSYRVQSNSEILYFKNNCNFESCILIGAMQFLAFWITVDIVVDENRSLFMFGMCQFDFIGSRILTVNLPGNDIDPSTTHIDFCYSICVVSGVSSQLRVGVQARSVNDNFKMRCHWRFPYLKMNILMILVSLYSCTRPFAFIVRFQ